MKSKHRLFDFLNRKIRRIRLNPRLLVSFLIVSIVPSLCIGIYSYNIYTRSIHDKLSQAAHQTTQLLNNNLMLQLNEYSDYISTLSVANEIQGYLSSVTSPYQTADRAQVRAISDLIERMPYLSKRILDVRIVDRYRNTVYSPGYNHFSSQALSVLMDATDLASPRDYLQYLRTYRGYDEVALCRKIYNADFTAEPIGYILVFIDETAVSQNILPVSTFGSGSNLLLMDSMGNAIFSMDQSLLGKPLTDEPFYASIASHADDRNFTTETDGAAGMAIYTYNAKYDVYTIATIPKTYITQGSVRIRFLIISVCILLASLSMLLSTLIYRSIVDPINCIIAACNVEKDQDLNLKINDTSPDELGFLARTIDNMTDEIMLLFQRLNYDDRRKRELELEMLQYQINPHFLFNTLNTLKWISTLNNVPVVSNGIDSLSCLLQSTLMKKDEFIPLQEEIANLKNYCNIQELRYVGRFEVEYLLHSDTLNCKVPRFILQPLVENSILHGTSDSDKLVHITVSSDVCDGMLTLTIRDNGTGFNVAAVRDKKDEHFTGIGLSNVDERLQLYYGRDSGLQLTSAEGVGTSCRIRIPLLAPKGENADV